MNGPNGSPTVNFRFSSLNEETLNSSYCFIGSELSGNSDTICSSEIQLVLTERGLCYQINADKRIPLKGGPLGAVKLITMTDLHRTLKLDFSPSGVEVFIKDQGSFPTRFDKGEVLTPGNYHTLDVSVEEITTIPYRKHAKVCFDNEHPDPYYPIPFYGPPEMVINSCYASNALIYLNQTLGCVDVTSNSTFAQNMEHCTMDELKKLLVYSGDIPINQKVVNFIDQKIMSSTSADRCLPPCRVKTYTALVHTSPLSSTAVKVVAAATHIPVNIVNRDLLVIEVVFPDIMSKVEEIKRYSFNNFLGDTGGVFGLFLGCSLFTYLEYIYFAIFYLVKRCRPQIKGDWLRES